MSILINPYVFVAAAAYDPDAADYISRVETGDGQALEVSVKDLINDLFVGCKADGIFGALKASCIFAAARTIPGALTPLLSSMPAPTNFGFVAGDYDRKTGLVGSKSSLKYLLANRRSNEDPQNNHHMSCYLTELNAIASGTHLALYAESGSDWNYIAFANNNLISRSRSSTPYVRSTVSNLGPSFLGNTRNNANDFVSRSWGTNVTTTATSVFPLTGGYLILGPGNTGNACVSRMSFYSIGESLDLALLDARVSTFMSSLAALSL